MFEKDISLGLYSHIVNSILQTPCCIRSNSIVVNSSIGHHTYLGEENRIRNARIGSYCSIAPNVIVGPGAHPIEYVSSSPVFYSAHRRFGEPWTKKEHWVESKTTYIGNDVWIGYNVLILDGVKIHDGAIIGANAVVTKDVAPYAIVGGVPARLIRYRFEEKVINQLLDIKWWDIEPAQLKKYIHLMDDVSLFIQAVKGIL